MNRSLLKALRFLVLVALMASGLSSCEESNGLVGIDFLDGSSLGFGSKTALPLRATTEQFDSLTTLRPSALVVGGYSDPIFGRVDAGFATELLLATVAPKFGSNPTVDSAVMILPYAGWYGDTSTAFSIRISRSDTALTDSLYYASSELHPGATWCDTTFAPGALVKTLKTGAKVGKAAMILKLRTSQLQEVIVDEALAAPSNFANNQAFSAYFRGLVVAGGAQNQAIYQFNPNDPVARIRMYYSNDSLRADTSANGKKYGTFDLLWTGSGATTQFNTIHFDRSTAQFDLTAQDTVLGSSSTYIQGMGGAVTVVRLDGLKALRDSGYVINYAELVVPVREGSNLRYTVPSVLNVLQVNGSTKKLIRDYARGNPGGFFSATGVLRQGSYKFAITRHVQDLLRTGDTGSFKLMLVPDRMASSPARVVLHGNADAVAPMSLNLWYTKPN